MGMERGPSLLMPPLFLTSLFTASRANSAVSVFSAFPFVSSLGNFKYHQIFPLRGTPRFVFQGEFKDVGTAVLFQILVAPLLPPLDLCFLENGSFFL